ncbi:hypothetical protein H4P12_10170 [Paracoccus sp. 11-3]|uniref:Uncharacterized protein n=1 Tax=Paracoccus amoyensis TaxID=2760093 RepID=A0A926GHF2_9RHOB|nr:hypothetical protein [Paracoccus amoyensis]MBC9247077.1 hypothetical protein [Paracoccus amoyensis]
MSEDIHNVIVATGQRGAASTMDANRIGWPSGSFVGGGRCGGDGGVSGASRIDCRKQKKIDEVQKVFQEALDKVKTPGRTWPLLPTPWPTP